MKTYRSGENCEPGLYVAPGRFDIQFIGSEGEALPGKAGADYYRLPPWLMIIVSPVLGGIFVLAFPLLVLGFFVLMLGQAAIRGVRTLARRAPHLLGMHWEPGMAYFRKAKPPESEKPAKKD